MVSGTGGGEGGVNKHYCMERNSTATREKTNFANDRKVSMYDDLLVARKRQTIELKIH